jgi:3-oxoacyl-ACP reductase-like protein
LLGGSHVIVTTSRSSRVIVKYYQEYSAFFTMVPLSSTSIGAQDHMEALLDYDANAGLDLYHIIPFAAVPKNGSRPIVLQV